MSLLQTNELLKEFREETLEHISAVESELLKLENGTGDTDTIHEIFRALHSIKGAAGFFSLQNIVELSHAMETIFDQVKNGSLIITDEITTNILSANDCLNKMVQDTANSTNMDISDHLSKLTEVIECQQLGLSKNSTSSDEMSFNETTPSASMDYQFMLTDAVSHGHNIFKFSCQTPRGMVENVATIGQIVHHYYFKTDTTPSSDSGQVFVITTVLEKDLVAAALDIPVRNIEELDVKTAREECTKKSPSPSPLALFDKEHTEDTQNTFNYGKSLANVSRNANQAIITSKPSSKTLHNSEVVRVNINLLNDLLNLASEMVLGRNRLLRVVETHRKDIPGLNGVLQNVDRITTELQEKVMQTRMQPLAKVFHKFPRLTRELSKQTGKNIELKIEGNDVELDKTIVESLGDPLTHLVRNSIDHGIETPEQREQLGKLKTGTISLKAYHEGGHVIIDVIDNGSGIDLEKLKTKAQENSLVDTSELALMGERELLDLLFRTGFSTADQVTDLSGRGVGLDVVKNNIDKLGGVMEILNNPGQGATFRLTLPITLAIVHSLLIEVEGLKFALPQVNLQEMVRIKPEESVGKLQVFQDSLVLRLRGKLVPTVRLSDVLGIAENNTSTQLIRVLVVKSGSKRFGLIVDRILDDEEILVKNLPRHLKDCPCYSGITVLGDGKIAMILDLEGIAAKAGFKFSEKQEIVSSHSLVTEDHLNEKQNLLLFKCSGPETFCIDLSMVARVEKITAEQIETIGDKEFIQFRETALRVIRLENYLSVGKTESNSNKLFVIIPKLVKHPIGILIEQMVDTVETNISFNPHDLKEKGLLGSAVLGNRITLIINMYELFELADPEHYVSPKEYATDKKNTILLVEDTPFFAKTEKNYLESAGYQVLSAANGREALDLLQHTKVDLVVSDIVMPVMNGFELVKRIRSDNKLAKLPVIAVTTRNDQRSMEEGIEAGFDYYEIKLSKDRFLSKVRLALEENKAAGNSSANDGFELEESICQTGREYYEKKF